MRNFSKQAFIESIEQRAEQIMTEFGDFTHGTRILFLLQRAKEGGDNKEFKRRNMRVVTHNKESLRNTLIKMLVLKNTVAENHRIYMIAAPRDLEKAEKQFKQIMLEADFSGKETHSFFWERLEDRWISALVKSNPPKNESVFVIDVDDKDDAAALKECARLNIEILKKYPTKNGHHIVVKPFNVALWEETSEIQKEGLLLLDW